MRVTVIRGEKPLGIPYLRQPGDPNSHGYIDLKLHPEQISLIPEARNWPELERTLITLNQPGSRYRTHGCEKALCCGDDGHGVSGYVGVRFEELAQAEDGLAYSSLFDAFKERASGGWPEDDVFVQFEMQPTLLREVRRQVWSVSVWIVVRGHKTEESAKERWSAALKFVCDSFVEAMPT